MKRPCLGVVVAGIYLPCGRFATRQGRCEEHRLLYQRTRRPSTAARGYGSAWQAYSKGRIAEMGSCQANPCGWPHSAGTPANPLTTDHVDLGLVLCRNDNARKQHADRG